MKNPFITIDVSAQAAEMGQALAGNQGINPQEFLMMLEQNSLRPFVPAEDPYAMCVSIPTGAFNAEGEPVMKTMRIGNATSTTLLKGDWEKIDAEVYGIAMGRMNLMNLFVGAGLTIPLDGMGVTRFSWQRMGKMGQARMDMDMMTTTEKDRMEFDTQSIPVPIISSSWDVNMRYLAETRKMGRPIDTIYAYWAAYAVASKGEDILVNGAGGFKADGGQIYGLRDTPVAITATISTDWTDSSVTGEDIVDEVSSFVAELRAKKHYGPYVLILPDRYSRKLSKDYKAQSDKSIMARLLEKESEQLTLNISRIEFSEQINDDPTDDTKYSNELYLVEMNKATVAIIDGMPLTDFQWQVKGPIVTEHKVAMIRVPLFRNDMEGQSGILRAKGTSTAKA